MGALFFSDLLFMQPFKNNNISGEMSFENYKEYLQYTYNSAHASGRIVEIVEMVKTQPRNMPFDFEFNTVEGNR